MKKLTPLAFAAIFLFGCCMPGGSAGPFDLVPASATSVATLSPSSVLNDPDFAYFYAKANSNRSINDEFAAITAATGVQMRNVTLAVLFSTGTGADRKSAAFLQGGFDASATEQRLRSDPSWSATDYAGYSVFRKSGENNAIAFIDGSLLVGAPSAVQSAIDVKKGTAQNIRSNAELMGILNKLNTSAELVYASESTGALPSELTSSPLNASFFSGVRASGLDISKRLETIDVNAVLLTDNSVEAGKLQGSLTTFATLATTVFAQPVGSLAGLIAKIHISSEGEYVLISLQTSVDELKPAETELNTPPA